MKPACSLIVLLMLSSILTACRLLPAASPSDPLIMTPEEVVESYYNWLMQYPGNPTAEYAYRESPFLTAPFIIRIDETVSGFRLGGADPFLCAQDIPEKVYVQQAEMDGDRSSVRVNTSFEGHYFNVDLVKEEGEWKISGVRCKGQ
jgi:hypothetical protein